MDSGATVSCYPPSIAIPFSVPQHSHFREEACVERRNIRLAVAGIALAAFLLRLWPLLLPGGPLGYRLNFDEGIYFTASAHLVNGSLPYRDLFFVHPPGLLLLLAPITCWANHGHVRAAFAASRYLATLVGAGNTALAGGIALRAFGPLAGISAALMYATFPEAVREERGPFLEPVLNLLGLGMAWLWLWPRSGRRQVIAGFLGGMSLAVKTWGAAWVIAVFTSLPRRRPAAAALSYLAGMAAGLMIVVFPFVLAAPHNFEAEVIQFHLQRGIQGVGHVLPGLWDMHVRHPLTSLFALTGAALALVGVRQRSAREDIYIAGFFTDVLGLSVAAFLVAPIYFHRYSSLSRAVCSSARRIGGELDAPTKPDPLAGARPGPGGARGAVPNSIRWLYAGIFPQSGPAPARRSHSKDGSSRVPHLCPGAGLADRGRPTARRSRRSPRRMAWIP